MWARKVRLRLTGYLLDLVDHHKGIRQAHLHRVIDRADLWNLNGDLKKKRGKINYQNHGDLSGTGWKNRSRLHQFNSTDKSTNLLLSPTGICRGIMQLQWAYGCIFGATDGAKMSNNFVRTDLYLRKKTKANIYGPFQFNLVCWFYRVKLNKSTVSWGWILKVNEMEQPSRNT